MALCRRAEKVTPHTVARNRFFTVVPFVSGFPPLSVYHLHENKGKRAAQAKRKRKPTCLQFKKTYLHPQRFCINDPFNKLTYFRDVEHFSCVSDSRFYHTDTLASLVLGHKLYGRLREGFRHPCLAKRNVSIFSRVKYSQFRPMSPPPKGGLPNTAWGPDILDPEC